jgi:hypothetical protein
MSEFFSINRYALIIRPSKAMVEWINATFPDDPPLDYEEMGGDDQLDVFLIPEFTSPEDAREWLQENCRQFLEFELEEWCTDPGRWPKNLDWPLFESFLEYTLQSVVLDTQDEEYDEEFEDWELN